MSNIKELLHKICSEHIATTIQEIEAAIDERREAIKSDTKSSMGDKYETSREMLQQDINMNLNRLSKVQVEEVVLQRIDSETTTTIVTEGSLVYTNNGNFYVAISAGKLNIDGAIFYAISLSSPIGMQLKGKKEGDSFSLNNRDYNIKQIL
ncbi:MAG: hypothetical protein R2800_12690 [Flavipsychrobacter sp.]